MLLRSTRRARVDVRWVRDAGDGSSGHREPQLAGIPAMKPGVRDEPCRHTACDSADRLERGAFARPLHLIAPLLG